MPYYAILYFYIEENQPENAKAYNFLYRPRQIKIVVTVRESGIIRKTL